MSKLKLPCGCIVHRDDQGREILVSQCVPCESFARECHDDSQAERTAARERAWEEA